MPVIYPCPFHPWIDDLDPKFSAKPSQSHVATAAIAVAPILGGERDDVRGQRILVGAAPRHLPLGRPMLAQDAAGDTVQDGEPLPDMIDTGPAAGGVRKSC